MEKKRERGNRKQTPSWCVQCAKRPKCLLIRIPLTKRPPLFKHLFWMHIPVCVCPLHRRTLYKNTRLCSRRSLCVYKSPAHRVLFVLLCVVFLTCKTKRSADRWRHQEESMTSSAQISSYTLYHFIKFGSFSFLLLLLLLVVFLSCKQRIKSFCDKITK